MKYSLLSMIVFLSLKVPMIGNKKGAEKFQYFGLPFQIYSISFLVRRDFNSAPILAISTIASSFFN